MRHEQIDIQDDDDFSSPASDVDDIIVKHLVATDIHNEGSVGFYLYLSESEFLNITVLRQAAKNAAQTL